MDFFSVGSESKAGVSGEAGVAGRDELSLRRRSCRTVGHIRRRIHVSLYESRPLSQEQVNMGVKTKSRDQKDTNGAQSLRAETISRFIK